MSIGTTRHVELHIGPHRFPREMEVQAQWSRSHDTQWLIEAEATQWLLDRVADGEIDAAQARDWMRTATSWTSGCCAYCDWAVDSHAEARQLMDDLISRWRHEQDAMTPDSHPYLLNKSLIHAWDCPTVSTANPVNHLTTLHAYAIELDGCGSIDRLLERHWESWTKTRRMTAADIAARLERRNPNARDPRCKRCSPPLPGAYLSQASDVQHR
ncbi:hypothetical protein FHX81_0416 [Saccharothrix saharensis]|uniref:Uncharacterized protein n=1 Tax=Saccharothrix saharensis TaxID=571190 RepID=A0A543J5V1_9PSEU|nr:hypothetical protein [Saccharothrix saharensis]TQM78162.1 hypothetical protein FHX81_0416 [Saccharothrix saharensis]